MSNEVWHVSRELERPQIIRDENRLEVARVYSSPVDARLIAAAPEMLAALQGLVEMYNVRAFPQMRKGSWEKALAAIAKADGPQS